MRVLVVEDDRALGMFLQKGLKIEGHEVAWVGDGDAAIELASTDVPDLIVLDLSLPRRDGMEVLTEVHRRHPETSVLVLTGRSQIDERVRCLDAGADDCLLKPFSFHELTARCRAILRRRARAGDSFVRFGGVEMNRLDRVVTREGEVIELTGKEFALLEFLLLRKGKACARGELLREVWQMPEDSPTNVVDVYINYLRRKLAMPEGSDVQAVSVIETVRGVGYRMGLGESVATKKAPVAARAEHQAGYAWSA
ncbi:response regulator transcription factor [Granulicella cerasi]|uniref:Response regulator transcription factor n=1 Tax=Granulicella cerasi TaxID=741063 RepID=A0ABW1Z3Z2_9BACT|nr:response regulator transcription factor [Granulicella cerasi]